MKFLIFLLIGTLIFGIQFPAYLFLFSLFAFVVFSLIILSLFRGSSAFKIYTNRPFGEYQDANDEFVREPKKIDADIFSDEELFVRRDEPDIFEEEGEIIDLPASALRKDD